MTIDGDLVERLESFREWFEANRKSIEDLLAGHHLSAGYIDSYYNAVFKSGLDASTIERFCDAVDDWKQGGSPRP